MSGETMELAPVATIREIDAEEVNPNHKPEFEFGGGDEGGDGSGIDDGFGDVAPRGPPANGGPQPPRRRPPIFPASPIPVPDDRGYSPLPPTHGRPGRRPLDINRYATAKTVAQGMMDIALLTANANQLRYVIEAGKFNSGTNYYTSLTLISLSIILQLVIGVMLIVLSRFNVLRAEHQQSAERINGAVIVCVFIITVLNVFISTFAVEPIEGVDPVLLRSALARMAEQPSLPPDP